MAAAMLLEEQVQQSMPTSEDDAEYEEDYDQDVDMGANAEAFAANNQLLNGVHNNHTNGSAYDEHGDENNEEEDEDHRQEDDLSDRDAEGEDDYEQDHGDTIRISMGGDGAMDDEEENEDDEDGEGVGAVKIQPREPDDDEDDAEFGQDDAEESEDAVDDASHDSSDESEVEAEAEWEAAVAQDDEAEPIDPNRCIFCHQDEEHDPSPEFEECLACAVCGDNAHRQCARDAEALEADEDAAKWRCPGCVSNALEPETVNQGTPSRGAIKPDSHSVFNNLIVDDDPMDGSRLLRKRKTSSAEAEEGVISSIGKRRKRTSDGSSNAIMTDAKAAENIDSHKVEPAEGFNNGNKAAEPATSRPSRSLRPLKVSKPPVTIEKHSQTSLIIRIRLNATDLARILANPPKPVKKRPRSTPAARRASTSAPPPAYIPRIYSQPFYSFHDKDMDELKSKPYGGILTEAQSDTTKTLPQADDRRMFDNARQKAEEEWAHKTALEHGEAENVKKPRKVSGPASQIECINFGGYEIDTWYAAPYPEEYSRNRVLHICEFCLKYMNSEYVAWRHKMKCSAKHPPGDEIYRDVSISVFEVDGRKNPVYCQNLCLLAKLFLGSKTLYYDVEPFLFYVMTEYDEFGCHFVGYFSKEKRPSSQNNVSCILTLPIHQRKGYGNLLIDFSYLLTLVERKSGSPEKPLSDMGLVSYRNYWRLVLCYRLLDTREEKRSISVIELSQQTGMTADDIVSALEGLRALVRDPVTGTYALRLDYDFYEEYIKKWEDKNYVRLNPHGLVWTPYIMGRNNQNMIEHAPPMSAIAPREDEDDEKLADATQPALTNGDIESEQTNGLTNGASFASSEQGDEMVLDPSLAETPIKGPSPATDTTFVPASPSSSRPSLQPLTNGRPHPDYPLAINTADDFSPIPPSRFEIYPPINASRIKAPRLSLSHPSATPRSARPSTARRATGSRALSTGSTRKASCSQRPTGGTGRGPGRWPKGTKKSDFGNAGSGPGLPPRLKEKSRLGVEVSLGEGLEEGKEESSEEDEGILYGTPGMTRRRNGGGQGKGKGKMAISDEEDFVVGDVDVDAEGGDE
ncbi:hypothetical protein VC83_00179 [Pseudogymnoascus destructans]|uniref:Histone acetyltransferase n=1 Tax=Pseudogymnoascus destructans TaxID=655981 RepID=A0A177AP88_9PEZI|nr:uncharacterized protein VC83_00179 [Pseudogymnoascus destructans]OAF63342.1 hypothetical protein VC83_00179 [Pseudogymnoascus destructans]